MRHIGSLQHHMELAQWATRIAGLFALVLFGLWGARRIVRYEDQITSYAKEIEERNRDLDSFAGRVAHDLRNALGPIVMSPHMLRQVSGPSERITAIADRIERCSERAIAIVNALLSFARASQKADANESAPLEVAVKDVREELAPLVAQLDVSVAVENIPKVHLRCSPGLLHIVLANLCGNAVKYLQGQPERRVRLSADIEGTLCRIEVEDTGPGIAKEEQARIFEPFFRVQGTRAQGTGIGLATVRRIVDARAGRIIVESDHGHGSRFIVWLPLAPSPG
jgi:signal transduction histidine kinase